ncbi:MAG: hypothetical protein QXO67_02375 [Candidatus Bathyarchaeia archaeon]
MTIEEKLAKELANGYFFNPRMVGVKRVRTLLSRWADDYTEEKRLRHLFSRAVKAITLPSPSYFALKLGTLGWWTTDRLMETEMANYKTKLEAVRAKLLKELSNPYFLARFKEIVGAHGLSPAELLDSIRVSLPTRKIQLIYMNETQKAEITKHYTTQIDRKVDAILASLRTLLAKGTLGRKARIDGLAKDFTIIRQLDIAEYRKNLIEDLSKAFGAISNLDRREFEHLNLEKYLNDNSLPKTIKSKIAQLLSDAKIDAVWRLK